MTDYRQHIIDAWNAASADDLANGLAWYGDSHAVARALATASPYTTRQCAGVLAAMSPGTSWPGNVTLARRIIDEHASGRPLPESGFGLRANVAKAWAILNGTDPEAVLGHTPKTGPFFRNIMGDPDAVTVDRWAKRVALNDPTASPTVNTREMRAISAAYMDAASAVGATPREVQAATWVWIRRTTARAQFSHPTIDDPSRMETP